MKKVILIILIASFPLAGCPKKPTIGNVTKKVQSLTITGADIDFKNLMIEAALEIDGCTLAPENCKNLPDPWKEGKMQTLPQQIETVRNDINSGKVQIIMARFENAMLNGKGGEVLTKSNLFTTFSYHSGYGLDTIKKRMDGYIGRLEETSKE